MQVQKAKQGYKLVKSLFGKYEEIPKEWEMKELGDLTKITDGSHFSPVKVDKGYKMATVENVSGNMIDIEACYQISKADYDQLVKNGDKPNIGDVLFTKDGTVGKSLVYNQKENIVLLSSIAIIRKSTNIDSNYCNYVLQSKFMKRHLGKYFGGTAIKRIVLKHLSKYEFPVPQLNQQQKIASILSSVDNLIESYDKVIENTKILKKGLMQQLLTKGIGHTKFKKIKLPYGKILQIPFEWCHQKLGSIASLLGGYAFKSKHYVNNGLRLLKISNVSHGRILWEEESFLPEEYWEQFPDYHLNSGDVVLAMTRPIISTGLKISFFEERKKTLLNQRVGKFLVKDNLDKNFLFYFLNQKYFLNQIENKISESNQPNISSKEVESIPIWFPIKMIEQQKISSIISEVDNRISHLEKDESRLKSLKKGLMQKLLTGQIRVKV